METGAKIPDEEKFNLAQQKARDGTLEEALTLFQELVHSNPQFPIYQLGLASTFKDMGDLEKAAIHFRICTQLSPEKEMISRCLFHCLWNQGRREEAIEEANRFLTIKDSVDYRNILQEIEQKSRQIGTDETDQT